MDEVVLDDLIARAKTGELLPSELPQVARALKETSGDKIYRLIYILGRAGAREYEGLVAKYLDYRVDPQVAALALNVLCKHWGLAVRYRDNVLNGLRGLDWDAFDEVRTAAISCAGEYLRSSQDCVVLRQLVVAAGPEHDALDRQFALEALARSLGDSDPTSLSPRDPGEKAVWEVSVMMRTERRVRSECSGN